MKIVVATLIALSLVTPGRSLAQDTLSPRAAVAGTVAGTVRDATGLPLRDVTVTVESDSGRRSTTTASNGRFLLERIAAGQRRFEARKAGYRTAEAILTVTGDSALLLDITLVSEAQALPQVIVESRIENRVTGTTIDREGAPVAGVIVEVIGLGRRDTTDADGRFGFLALDEGNYLFQWRKDGYGVAQSGLRMVDGLERELTVRMLPRDARDGFTPEVAASVALETTRRLRLKGGAAAVVGRDELDRFGRERLSVALASSSAAIALWSTRTECVLVDGYDPATTQTARAFRVSGSRPRTVTSIDPRGTRTRSQATAPAVDRPANPPGAMSGVASGMTWLSHFRADEVEMVEIYPEGSENSRTICGRFPPSSACSCPPEPAGIIVWLR
jgi:hypothetical protein